MKRARRKLTFLATLAAWALALMGHRQVTGPMLEALRDDDPAVQKKAAWVLGAAGHEQAIGPLRNVLCDRRDKSEVRRAAAEALIQMAGPAVERCAEVLAHGHDSTRVLVLRPLLAREVIRARWDRLLPHWEGYDWPRTDAQRRLLARQQAVEESLWSDPLLAALADKEADVVCAAAGALARLADPRALQPVEEAWQAMERESRRIRGPMRQEGLFLDLSAALAKLGDPGRDLLVEALEDPDEFIRTTAALALAESGAQPAVDKVLSAMSDLPGTARMRIVRRLGNTNTPGGRTALVRVLKAEPDFFIRAEILHALHRMGDERAVSLLMDRLKNDPERRVRRLTQMQDPRALAPLREAARDDPCLSVRRMAALAAWELARRGAHVRRDAGHPPMTERSARRLLRPEAPNLPSLATGYNGVATMVVVARPG